MNQAMNQALSNGLALLKLELIKIDAQQLARALGMLNDLLPVDDALPCGGWIICWCEPESNNYVLNTTTLYGCTFEQRDKISVRERKVGDEKSTS